MKCVAFAPGGKLLASGGLDRTVRLWDATTGKELRTLAGHTAGVTALAFAPDGQRLASSSEDGKVRLWDVDNGKELLRLDGPASNGATLAFSSNGKRLIAGSRPYRPMIENRGVRGGRVCVWELSGGKRLRQFETDQYATISALSPDGAVALAADGVPELPEAAERVRLWDTVSGKRLCDLPLRLVRDDRTSLRCLGATFSSGGRLIATSQVVQWQGGYDSSALRLWERATGQEILKIENTLPHSLAFSPNGRLLAADNGNVFNALRRVWGCGINLWDVRTGEKVGQLGEHWSRVYCLTFSPDGAHLASGSADHTILLWEVPRPARKPTPAATANQLQAWWSELGGDAAAAHKASAQLAARPAQAVPLFVKHLKPAPAVDGKQIAALLRELDDKRFAVRDRASTALEQWGELAEPTLRQALAKPASLEYRRRLEQLLGKQDGVPAAAQLRRLRALAVLEYDGGAEARRLLTALAAGAPEARVTQEARAALRRLDAWAALGK